MQTPKEELSEISKFFVALLIVIILVAQESWVYLIRRPIVPIVVIGLLLFYFTGDFSALKALF